MAPQPVTLDELKAKQGKSLGTSKWIEVSQSRIDGFADVTEDWQFIHVDHERATAETPFGGTIAHGFLTLSLLPAMSAEVIPRLKDLAMSINYGIDKMRFLNPVPSGSRVRAHIKLLEVAPKPDNRRVLIRYEIEVEVDGQDKPALIVEWLGLAVRKQQTSDRAVNAQH